MALIWAICWSLFGLCDSRRLRAGHPEMVTRTKTRKEDASRIGMETRSRRTMNSNIGERAPRACSMRDDPTEPGGPGDGGDAPSPDRRAAGGPSARRERQTALQSWMFQVSPHWVGLNSMPDVSSSGLEPREREHRDRGQVRPQDRVDLVGQLVDLCGVEDVLNCVDQSVDLGVGVVALVVATAGLVLSSDRTRLPGPPAQANIASRSCRRAARPRRRSSTPASMISKPTWSQFALSSATWSVRRWFGVR